MGHLLYDGANGGLFQDDLCHTPCLPGLMQPEPLSLWQATADPCLHRRHSNTQTQVWLSLLWGLWVLVHTKLFWALHLTVYIWFWIRFWLTVWITTNCVKFLKRWEYQTILPASWETCMQIKKQQLEPDMEQDWSETGKGVHQGCIVSPCLFNLYAVHVMWNARLFESQSGIKIAGRNIYNLRYADDTTLMAESRKELKSLLMRVKEEN